MGEVRCRCRTTSFAESGSSKMRAHPGAQVVHPWPGHWNHARYQQFVMNFDSSRKDKYMEKQFTKGVGEPVPNQPEHILPTEEKCPFSNGGPRHTAAGGPGNANWW